MTYSEAREILGDKIEPCLRGTGWHEAVVVAVEALEIVSRAVGADTPAVMTSNTKQEGDMPGTEEADEPQEFCAECAVSYTRE